MNKTRFSDSEDTGARDIAKAEVQRADRAARECTKMKNRIRQFFSTVEYVVFDSAENAPAWADDWFDYLMTGQVPPPAPVVEEVAADAETVEVEALEDTSTGEVVEAENEVGLDNG